MEHFATGEGITFAMAAVHAESEEDAKKEFCLKYICDASLIENTEYIQGCISYFSHGVVVYDIGDETQHAKVKNIMKDFFTEKNIEHMFAYNNVGALIDFYYKSYVNYS